MTFEETRDNTTAIEAVMMAADSAEEILVALGHSPEAADQMVNPRDGANPTTVCPCGEVVEIEWDAAWGGGWDVCGVECPKCGRRSCGGNSRDATVNSWMTAREIDRSNAAFEQMEFEADLYAETGIRYG